MDRHDIFNQWLDLIRLWLDDNVMELICIFDEDPPLDCISDEDLPLECIPDGDPITPEIFNRHWIIRVVTKM